MTYDGPDAVTRDAGNLGQRPCPLDELRPAPHGGLAPAPAPKASALHQPPEIPGGRVNVTDPDSKLLKTTEGFVQGYNAQAVVDEGQIVLAAEITNSTVARLR